MQGVWSVAIAILCATGLAARADEASVGCVKTLAGTATVTHGAVASPAALGMPVYEEDRLETGSDGEIGVTFRDNTRVSLGPDSRMELKRFVFKPAVKEYGFILRVAYGTLEYISGLTEKLAPRAMSIETPGFTVGARGTKLLVRVEKQR